ncbi:MAG: sodium pump decarboxylase subunit gamma [Gammaproteobacteria bacterium]|jgi:oxaloacetate decarboxylase gamma subunit|nr:sodium pump decarboxylase subunit gamma [Gammaproteobacteria bacterium]
MPETSLINESLSLMAIGMGIVFSFLLLLVVLLRAMSWIAGRLSSGLPEASAPSAAVSTGSDALGASNDELIAVISAAIARYRSSRR